MIFKRTHKALFIILLLCIAIGGFLWFRSYVFNNMGLSLQKKIDALKLSGFNIKYDSLSISWHQNVIQVHGLLLEKNVYDTTCLYPEFIAVAQVRAEGIRLFPLLFDNVLDFEVLYLDTPRAIIRQNSLLKLDSAAQRENEFTLKVEKILLRAADLQYTDSAACRLITGIGSNVNVGGLMLDFRADNPLEYSIASLTLDNTVVTRPRDFYTYRVAQTKYDAQHKRLAIDSISIIPAYGKVEFGRKRGYEIDRFEGLVPFIKADNFTFSSGDSAHLKIGSAEVRFYLKLFRDKRLPFKKVPKLLPVEAIRELPFGLHIDSLRITNSYVQYEEFPEEASEAGGIFFDNLYATITNFTNVTDTGATRLVAQAALMGSGKMSVSVNFPLARGKRSSLTGALVNFPLTRINPMLGPSTNLKVESGKMKRLSFSFTFNNVRSDGEIELNYEDLKLILFKPDEKKKGKELEKDNLKTFIMNTFIFRKNMDEDVPEEKRTGTVMYARDENRSIFNFWSKSLLSGIKSAYNLDKVAEKKSAREQKKEERLARRLERKMKKEEKRKDRG